jgi:hypothetical protein
MLGHDRSSGSVGIGRDRQIMSNKWGRVNYPAENQPGKALWGCFSAGLTLSMEIAKTLTSQDSGDG